MGWYDKNEPIKTKRIKEQFAGKKVAIDLRNCYTTDASYMIGSRPVKSGMQIDIDNEIIKAIGDNTITRGPLDSSYSRERDRRFHYVDDDGFFTEASKNGCMNYIIFVPTVKYGSGGIAMSNMKENVAKNLAAIESAVKLSKA